MRQRPSIHLFAQLAVFLSGSICCAWAACGNTEQDRIVWARERMHPSATKPQLDLVYQWLANGTRSCSESGDLWYYRGLAARKLNNQRDAEYSFRKAEENGSKAKGDGFDPFGAPSRTSVSPPNRIHDKWALVVGVADFKNTDDYLQYSVKDAVEFGKFLVQSGNFKQDNVKVLVDKDATTGGIREAFGTMRTKAKPDDLVLIYLSSHGQPRDLDPTGLSYVLTYDTDTSNPARTFATSLQMVELAELGRWVQAHDYVLLLDTCFSGAARPGVSGTTVPAGPDGLDPLQGLQGSGNRVVITASRADERSFEDSKSKHGYFTRFLLEALRKDNAHMPLASVYDYLRDRVSTEVADREGKQQHPVMQSFGAGRDIVLSAPLLTASVATLGGRE
ncbi:MAG: caspase family protein [Acidobacteriota bacterium]|nr:caspase family protein [Acidobacteriota bacterium]